MLPFDEKILVISGNVEIAHKNFHFNRDYPLATIKNINELTLDILISLFLSLYAQDTLTITQHNIWNRLTIFPNKENIEEYSIAYREYIDSMKNAANNCANIIYSLEKFPEKYHWKSDCERFNINIGMISANLIEEKIDI